MIILYMMLNAVFSVVVIGDGIAYWDIQNTNMKMLLIVLYLINVFLWYLIGCAL